MRAAYVVFILCVIGIVVGCGIAGNNIGDSNSDPGTRAGINTAPRIINIFIDKNHVNAPCAITFTPVVQDAEEPTLNLTYLWDFGDGTTSNAKAPVHTYTWQDASGFNYILTVSDSGGLSDTMEAPSRIYVDGGNHRPSITSCTVSKPTADAHETLTFSGSGSDVDVGDTLSYHWDFGDGTTSNITNPTHAYTRNGLYTVRFTVSDQVGAFIGQTLEIGVGVKIPPTIDTFSWNPLTGTAPVTINFTCTASDPDGTVVSYYWDLGNHTNSTTQNPTVNYTYGGDLLVRLTVVDNDGLATVSENYVHIDGTGE